MHKRNESSLGFTIVELLIVIVVIAILASITVIAYRGLQDRAYNSKAVSIIDSYEKLFRMYKTDHGEYPSVASSAFSSVCVGSPTDFPEDDTFAEGSCSNGYFTVGGWMVNYDGDNKIAIDDTLNNMLLQYASQLPDASLPAVSLANYPDFPILNMDMRGVVYSNPNTMLGNHLGLEAEQRPTTLHYVIKGKHGCLRGRGVYMKPSSGGGLRPTSNLNDPAITATMCATILP